MTKKFGRLVANDDISIEIAKGEILSIIGENGAGKSTFCKMVTGIYQPNAGKMFINNQEVHFKNVHESVAAGISMVYQERNLIGLLNAPQNICLHKEPGKGFMISEKEAKRRAQELCKKLNVNIPMDIPVEELGVGNQQLIEIMRALNTNPKLLILDEPTASLGEGEVEPFIKFIKNMTSAMDISVIFISHKIDEVFEISDRICVFTDGKNVLTADKNKITQSQCIQAMLRNNVLEPISVPEKDFSAANVILDVRHGRYDAKDHDINMSVRAGEVVGCYGLVGSGRTEFAEYLFGLRKAFVKEFYFNGEKITKGTPYSMIERGLILTPEKRANGIYKNLSIAANICNLFLDNRLSNKLGFVKFKKGRDFARDVLKKNNVKYLNESQEISKLSGGNIQKIIIGRSVEVEGIKLGIFDEPTNGMDVGAKHEVYQQIRRLADVRNIAVLFISSELEELLMTCNRIYVFSDGNIIRSFERKDFDKAKIVETAIRGKAV